MKKNIRLVFAGFIVLLLGFQSCEKDENENETKISSYNSTESHNMGENCMNCHQSGGSGEGWFIVAGTVYDKAKTAIYPNATIRLYTGPNGTGNLEATIQADKNGNFYTTEFIDIVSGLYPAVEGSTGTEYMNSSVTSGECNSCHGASTQRVWAQ